ncbi:unnamed protein product [Gadus morhua 'NCC']
MLFKRPPAPFKGLVQGEVCSFEVFRSGPPLSTNILFFFFSGRDPTNPTLKAFFYPSGVKEQLVSTGHLVFWKDSQTGQRGNPRSVSVLPVPVGFINAPLRCFGRSGTLQWDPKENRSLGSADPIYLRL